MAWHVGSQLYVWMQDCDARKVELEGQLDAIFKATAQAGYEGVEGFAGLVSTPQRVEQMQQLIAQHHVATPSFYVNSTLHEKVRAQASIAAIVQRAAAFRQLGATFVNTNSEPISWKGGREKTDAELATQAAALNDLGRWLRDEGLSLVIHGHDLEFRNDAREMRYNLDHTDPALVGLCLDTHWAYRGGADCFGLTRQYASRLRTLHLRNSVVGIWSETLGDGDFDYRKYAALLREVKFTEGWLFVELAIEKGTPDTNPLAEDAKLSREYVREVFGV